MYTNSVEDVFFIEGSEGLRLRGGNDSLKYSNISLNQNGDITNIFTDFNLGGKNKNELMKLNKNNLVELFGKPQRSMNCDCNCIVFSYSKLKDGPYRGKRPKINLKRILFSNNKVKRKIHIEGNPYNPYVGIFEIVKN